MRTSSFAFWAVVVLSLSGRVEAGAMGVWNWADDVPEYSSSIKNHGGALMNASTTWWLTGPPDATETNDYMGGWSSVAPDEYIVMSWNTPLPDVAGDDLWIRMYGGPKASARVLASDDGVTFSPIGTLGGGTAGVFRDEWFDFAGQFSQGVSHVRLERVGDGAQTGMFFDAMAGVAVPEPSTVGLIATGMGLMVLARYRKRRRRTR